MKAVLLFTLALLLLATSDGQTTLSGKITTSGKADRATCRASPCGPLNPGTMATSNVLNPTAMTADWSNPNNAKVSDDSRATASVPVNDSTYYLYASNFGFAIPPGKTIDGIVVGVECSGSGINNSYTNLIVNGVLFDNFERTLVCGGGEAYVDTGDVNDLWDTGGLTVAHVNASSFGVAFFYNSNIGTQSVAVDHIRMTVYYH